MKLYATGVRESNLWFYLLADDIGIFLVEIRAVNEKAKTICEKRGFTAMDDEPLKLYMNLKKVRKLLAE